MDRKTLYVCTYIHVLQFLKRCDWISFSISLSFKINSPCKNDLCIVFRCWNISLFGISSYFLAWTNENKTKIFFGFERVKCVLSGFFFIFFFYSHFLTSIFCFHPNLSHDTNFLICDYLENSRSKVWTSWCLPLLKYKNSVVIYNRLKMQILNLISR